MIHKYENLQYQNILPYTFGDLTVVTAGADVYVNDTNTYEDQLAFLPLIDIVFLE